MGRLVARAASVSKGRRGARTFQYIPSVVLFVFKGKRKGQYRECFSLVFPCVTILQLEHIKHPVNHIFHFQVR